MAEHTRDIFVIYLFIHLIKSTFEDAPEVQNPHYVSFEKGQEIALLNYFYSSH